MLRGRARGRSAGDVLGALGGEEERISPRVEVVGDAPMVEDDRPDLSPRASARLAGEHHPQAAGP